MKIRLSLICALLWFTAVGLWAQITISGSIVTSGSVNAGTVVFFEDNFETGDTSKWNFSSSTATASTELPYQGSYSGKITYKLCGNPQSGPTLSDVAGGSLSQHTVYVTIAYTNGTGETDDSPEVNRTVAANNVLRVNNPGPSPDMTNYHVYAGTVSGTRYQQTFSGAVSIGSNWDEPTSCPGGHTCLSGTNLVDDTASPPTSNTAGCGVAHQDVGGYFRKYFTSAPYANGLEYYYIRAYFRFKINNGGTSLSGIGRKMYYFFGGGDSDTWHGVFATTIGSPAAFGFSWTLGAPGGGCLGADTISDRDWAPCIPSNIGDRRTNQYNWVFDNWYYVEQRVRANTPSTNDAASQVWIQRIGTDPSPLLVLEHRDGNYRDAQTVGVQKFQVGEQADRQNWQPVDEVRYIDNVKIASSYIGP